MAGGGVGVGGGEVGGRGGEVGVGDGCGAGRVEDEVIRI